jgi:O-Antigen ligase
MTNPLPYPASWPRTTARHRRADLLGILLGGYVVLLPYQFEIGKGMNFAPADCLLVLVLLLAAGQLRYRKPAWTVWHLGIVLTFVTGSLVAALRFGTLARYEFLNKDLGLLLPFLCYAAITTAVAEWEDLRRFLRIFVLGVVFENTLAVASYLAAYFFGVASPFARYGGLRLSGMLLDPNAYGGLLVAALVICEASSWGPAPLFGRAVLWVSRATLLAGILFTFSRSAWVALGLALLVLSVVRIRVVFRLMMPVVLGAPVLALFLGPRFVGIFEEMARRPQQVQQRFDLIHAALDSFARYPFLGGGLGSFRLSNGEVAHNTAMWFLADFGILGLAALLGFIGWFFAVSWMAYQSAPEREKPIALAVLAAHSAMLGLAMGIEAFYQRHWWVIFALIASSYYLSLRPSAQARREAEVLVHVET